MLVLFRAPIKNIHLPGHRRLARALLDVDAPPLVTIVGRRARSGPRLAMASAGTGHLRGVRQKYGNVKQMSGSQNATRMLAVPYRRRLLQDNKNVNESMGSDERYQALQVKVRTHSRTQIMNVAEILHTMHICT